ncbi:alpha-mannosidase 2x [Dorcoceras hygrometricum]|uniref:Alpha-mannosidase 2x n=1 Tax=Dorcoceras hygrometricum TaxID=472368 RepID=A0A2Z7C1J2_9LAMI|nr:alpha-mannosidase 2x [Dorcoceras hygrometricum]
MSLVDLQDVCIAIGTLATLDLPMVVDLIGIYGLKGPYCTQTTTSWFLQALSVIPRGSWGDVARVFGISSSVIVLSIRYGFELILRRGYGLEKLLRGRAVIPHSHLPAGIVAAMRRVVNYHSSWARQQQVELFDAAGKWGLVSWRVAHYHTVNSPRGH